MTVVEVSVGFDIADIIDETTPNLMKNVATKAINVPKKAAKKTFENLFVQSEEKPLPEIKKDEFILYKCSCNNCHKTIITNTLDDNKCSNCSNTSFSAEEIRIQAIFTSAAENWARLLLL